MLRKLSLFMKAIGIFYKLVLEAVPDSMGFSLSDTTNIIIGNIPHKVAFRTWATDNMFEMPEKIKVSVRHTYRRTV